MCQTRILIKLQAAGLQLVKKGLQRKLFLTKFVKFADTFFLQSNYQ